LKACNQVAYLNLGGDEAGDMFGDSCVGGGVMVGIEERENEKVHW